MTSPVDLPDLRPRALAVGVNLTHSVEEGTRAYTEHITRAGAGTVEQTTHTDPHIRRLLEWGSVPTVVRLRGTTRTYARIRDFADEAGYTRMWTFAGFADLITAAQRLDTALHAWWGEDFSDSLSYVGFDLYNVVVHSVGVAYDGIQRPAKYPGADIANAGELDQVTSLITQRVQTLAEIAEQRLQDLPTPTASQCSGEEVVSHAAFVFTVMTEIQATAHYLLETYCR